MDGNVHYLDELTEALLHLRLCIPASHERRSFVPDDPRTSAGAGPSPSAFPSPVHEEINVAPMVKEDPPFLTAQELRACVPKAGIAAPALLEKLLGGRVVGDEKLKRIVTLMREILMMDKDEKFFFPRPTDVGLRPGKSATLPPKQMMTPPTERPLPLNDGHSTLCKMRSKALPQQPKLITSTGDGANAPKNVNGKQLNPILFRWEGNEEDLALFEVPADMTETSPLRNIGHGGYGTVILWEKKRRNLWPLRLAVKDSSPSAIFQDYCSEGHLTRRLNDLGCKNVINVVEWLYLENSSWKNFKGEIVTGPKYRICYEYAEHSDFYKLLRWYKARLLILPEGFIWHLLYSMANALGYCRKGSNPCYPDPLLSWDVIVHGDIKPENILLTEPDNETNSLYPCMKLADFGLAHTLGESVKDVQYYYSNFRLGTPGYIAPEVDSKVAEQENRRRAPHELHGSYSDIYSLGATCQDALKLLENYADCSYKNFTFVRLYKDEGESLDKLRSFYSPELRCILRGCTEVDPRRRLRLGHLYLMCNWERHIHHNKADAEAAAAEAEGADRGFFHNRVLYSQEDQNLYDKDPAFRQKYRKANLERWGKFLTEWGTEMRQKDWKTSERTPQDGQDSRVKKSKTARLPSQKRK